MASYFLSIGSNCRGRKANVERALTRIIEMMPEARASFIYETPDIHGGPSPYMNAVVFCKSSIGDEELEKIFKQMEVEFGRDSEARLRGEVPLDIDIVARDGQILRQRDFDARFFQIGYRDLLRERNGFIPIA